MMVLLLLVVALCHVVNGGAVLGIDFGSQNIKVGIIKGGTREVLLNKEGKRKVAAIVGFRNNERTFSAAASSVLKSYPQLVQRYTKHLLARPNTHPWVKRNAEHFTTEIFNDSRGSAAVPLGNRTVSAVEVVSWLLKEARLAARHHAGVYVYQCVISVPPFFTHWERSAILEAADMAGLDVLSLVNEGTAAAVDYFISRTVEKEAKHVIIYDMGDVSTKAQLVRFETVPENPKDPKNLKEIDLATVLDVAWDDSLGGRNFDENLQQHLMKIAAKDSGLDIKNNVRAMERLRAEARRVKEVLSANTDIEARCESLVGEYNFKTKVTRSDLERMNGPLFSELLNPIKMLLTSNDMTVANITEIQVIGGGARVPKVRETIAAFFKRPVVDTNLNGDDSICMGAVFYAAMKSKSFKKQKFKFRDLTLFPVSMSHPSIGTEPAGEHKMLFDFKNKLFSKKIVSFNTTEGVWMKLRYEIDAGPRRLPAGTPRDLVKVEVSPVNTTTYNVTEGNVPKVSVAFRLTSSGTIKVESAHAVIEVWEQPPPITATTTKKTTKPPQVINVTNSTGEDGSKKEEESTTSTTEEETTTPAPIIPDPIKVKKKIKLEWKETWLGVRDYSKDEKEFMRAHTKQLEDEEQVKRDKEEAVNDLESFIYATKERLTDDDMERHGTVAEREKLMEKLNVAGDYLEGEEVETDAVKVVKDKLFDLKELYRVIERRTKLWRGLPDAFKACRAELRKTEQSLVNITLIRQVNETEVEEVVSKFNETRAHLKEKQQEWKKQKESEDPIITPTDIKLQCDVAKGRARRLLYAPKRKKTTTTTASTTTEAEATDDPKKQDL